MKRVANQVVAAIASALYPSRNFFDQYEAPKQSFTLKHRNNDFSSTPEASQQLLVIDTSVWDNLC